MTNFQVYRKTLSFSLLSFAVDLLALVALLGLTAGGFFIAYAATNQDAVSAIVGLIIGFILGIIAVSLINIFVRNRIKAAQIAMMTKGVTEGALPDKTFHAGFEELRGRFGSITLFFFITNAIKGAFRQLGRGINRVGTMVGGDTGNTITSVINSAIQTLVAYLCDCCLGWILYRKDINAARAGCEGAVIFFRSGKTLFRNIGRIFGMGFLSFLIVGGGLFGIGYLIFSQFPQLFETLLKVINEADGDAASTALNDTTVFAIFFSAIIAIFLWSGLHSVLVRPFILVGVLRNYMAAGQQSMPTEADFEEVAKKAPKLRKLQSKME